MLRTAAAGLCPSVVCQPSGNSPPPARTRGLDQPSTDEVPNSRFRDADVTANADEPDTPLGDETAGEPLGCAQPGVLDPGIPDLRLARG